MATTSEKAAAALELLPEEMREPAVAYLIEQAEKFRDLKKMLAEGMDDVASKPSRNGTFKISSARRAQGASSVTILNENSRIAKAHQGFTANLFLSR